MRKIILWFLILALGIVIGMTISSAQLNNPTAYWKFDETGFPVIANDSKGILNFTLNNTVLRMQQGKIAGAIRSNNSIVDLARNSTTVPNSLILDSNPFTIVFWINASNGGGGTGYAVLGRAGDTATRWTINTNSGNNNLTFASNSAGVLSSPNTTLNGSYNRVVFVREGTGANQFRVYINNINTGNATLSGNLSDNTNNLAIGTANGVSTGFNLDDVRIYNNYAWTVSDVRTDWLSAMNQITLNSPTENQVIFSPSHIFNMTASSSGVMRNITNITSYIYYSNNSLFRVDTNNTPVRNNTLINISGFNVNDYFWDAYACGRNQTNGIVCFNSIYGNTSFSWGYSFAEAFQSSVVEGSVQTIYLNISIASSNSLSSANLIYDGTSYTGSISQTNSTLYQITRTFTTPLVTNDDSKLFNWNITFQSMFNDATPFRNQSIVALNFGSCASFPTLILNYSVFDEDTLARLTGADNVTIQTYVELIPSGATVPVTTFNRTFNVVNSTNTASVCAGANVLGNGTYSMNVQTDYISALHEPESYDYQNYTLNSTTGHLSIDLYNLLTTNAQQFKIRYLDRAFIPVSNVIIEIQRFYTGLGRNLIVESITTGNDGASVGSLVLNDELYTFVVKRNNQNLSVFSNLRAFCNSAIAECEIDLPARTSSGQLTSQTCSNNLCISSSSYNATTRIYSMTFNSIDGSTSTVAVNITKTGTGTAGTRQICYNSMVSSSGTLTCTISLSDSNINAYARVYSNSLLIGSDVFYTEAIDNATYGEFRILLAIALIISLAGVFSSNRNLTLFAIILGFLISGWLYLINLGSLTSSLGILVWIILVVVILIIKNKSSTKEYGQ